jgi:hypothetical protein
MRSPDPNSRYVPRHEATEFPASALTSIGGPRPEPGTPLLDELAEPPWVARLEAKLDRILKILRPGEVRSG